MKPAICIGVHAVFAPRAYRRLAARRRRRASSPPTRSPTRPTPSMSARCWPKACASLWTTEDAMKHAVIVAHPNPDSFTLAVARTYCEAVTAKGHEPLLRDLYAMDFDPRLKASEIPRPHGLRAGRRCRRPNARCSRMRRSSPSSIRSGSMRRRRSSKAISTASSASASPMARKAAPAISRFWRAQDDQLHLVRRADGMGAEDRRLGCRTDPVRQAFGGALRACRAGSRAFRRHRAGHPRRCGRAPFRPGARGGGEIFLSTGFAPRRACGRFERWTRTISKKPSSPFCPSPEHYGLPQREDRAHRNPRRHRLSGRRPRLQAQARHQISLYGLIRRPKSRKAMCERELEINRRMAPEIYLEVRSILQGVDGYLRFGPDEAAAARDHVVVMRRFDQDTLFGRLCDHGKLTPELMRRTGRDRSPAFMRRPRSTTDFGGAEGFAGVLDENNTIFASMAGAPFDADAVDGLCARQRGGTGRASERPPRPRGATAGQVRRCHGDLHLNNVVPVRRQADAVRRHRIRRRFRLHRRALRSCLSADGSGAPRRAARWRMRCSTAIWKSPATMTGWRRCRCFSPAAPAIRAHVTVSRAKATAMTGRAATKRKAYFELARGFLRPPPPRLVVIGGLSGTGKTTIARRVAPASGPRAGCGDRLRSDVTRKRLMGVAEDDAPARKRLYARDQRKSVPRHGEDGARILAAGHCVVMDAVYGTAEERSDIADVAARAGARFDGLWLAADAELLASRIAGAKRRCLRCDGRGAEETACRHRARRPTGQSIDASGTPDDNRPAFVLSKLNKA